MNKTDQQIELLKQVVERLDTLIALHVEEKERTDKLWQESEAAQKDLDAKLEAIERVRRERLDGRYGEAAPKTSLKN